MSKKKQVGNCYTEALGLLYKYADKENLRLVHGYPKLIAGKDKGKQFGHAWIEFTQTLDLSFPIIFDYCVDRLMPDNPMLKKLYYAVGSIDPFECSYYTLQEALDNLKEHNHVGPWIDKVPDALFKGKKK